MPPVALVSVIGWVVPPGAVAGWPGLVEVTLPTVSLFTKGVVVKPDRTGVSP